MYWLQPRMVMANAQLMEEYPVQKRGGQGVIAIQTSGRNGNVVGAVAVSDDDEIMLITDSGTSGKNTC